MSNERYSHTPRDVPSPPAGPRAFKSSPPLTGVDELKRYHELQHVLEERWRLLRDIDAGPRDVVVMADRHDDVGTESLGECVGEGAGRAQGKG
jgi:hypothetical protein